jgi:hypothetical protein
MNPRSGKMESDTFLGQHRKERWSCARCLENRDESDLYKKSHSVVWQVRLRTAVIPELGGSRWAGSACMVANLNPLQVLKLGRLAPA